MCYKKAYIEVQVELLMEHSKNAMRKNITKLLNSGTIDFESYDTEHNSMVLPKAIWVAILEDEATQFTPPTNDTRSFKKNVKNFKNLL